ncbi:MAG: hypothetical protein WC623_06915 [Pedobacter sp.]|uniref:hypothetical protein n=1 Tax=Pedobacter sp. TaxID=1411316 RepID=UPI00356A43C7
MATQENTSQVSDQNQTPATDADNYQQPQATGQPQKVLIEATITGETDELDPSFHQQDPPIDPENDDKVEDNEDDELPTKEDEEEDHDLNHDADDDLSLNNDDQNELN